MAELVALEDSVAELPDDELRELAAIVDNLLVRVHTEQAARRRGRSPRGQVEQVAFRLGARASCVFCRRVYVAELVPEHLLLDHYDDLRAWRRTRSTAA
ncbi:hypothetical protein [Amycolatopsis minnesotensis]|uniref:HNH endonuclease n=1 Tax=Amycolatopsis minnesotensis TaxID=337894 RepID=A0ABN2R1U6_9PSEU